MLLEYFELVNAEIGILITPKKIPVSKLNYLTKNPELLSMCGRGHRIFIGTISLEEEKFLPEAGSNDWQSSMAQDVMKGRKTEIRFMNGYISANGKSMGVPTPFHDAVTQIVKEIDDGSRLPNVKNIDDVIHMTN